MAGALPNGEAERALSFRVGGKMFVLAARQVVKIVDRPRLTRVPNAPPSLLGLMNLAGAAVPILSLTQMLGLPDERGVGAGTIGRVIVCEVADSPIGLAVDETLALTADEAGQRLDLAALLAAHFRPRATAAAPAAARRIAAQTSVAPAQQSRRALLVFKIAGQDYALPVEAVREVFPLPADIATLPRPGTADLGLIAHGNATLPLLSLAGLLGLPEPQGGDGAMVVLATAPGELVGLVTGAMDAVRQIPHTHIDTVPAILARGQGEAQIDAIARLDGGARLVAILSPERLLRNPMVAGAVSAHFQTFGQMTQASVMSSAVEQFVIFRLGEDSYGLPARSVDAVLRLPDTVTRVPRAPAFVAGVINVEGRALPLVDQRRRFASTGAAATRPRVLVVTIDGLQAGFIVDSASEIVRIPADAIAPAPAMPGAATQVFDRIATYGADNRLLLLVDPKTLLERAERDLIADLAPESLGAAR